MTLSATRDRANILQLLVAEEGSAIVTGTSRALSPSGAGNRLKYPSFLRFLGLYRKTVEIRYRDISLPLMFAEPGVIEAVAELLSPGGDAPPLRGGVRVTRRLRRWPGRIAAGRPARAA